MAKAVEIPVYLFTGFLEGGKTRFIRETLEDKKFNAGEHTLLVLCEEGEEEYDVSTYPHKEVYEQVLDYDELSPEMLTGLQKKYNAPTIHIETYGDGLLLIGLEREGIAMQPEIGLEHEDVVAKIPLENELRGQFGEADFIVYIPAGVDADLIRTEIEKYKQALTKYKIIQN